MVREARLRPEFATLYPGCGPRDRTPRRRSPSISSAVSSVARGTSLWRCGSSTPRISSSEARAGELERGPHAHRHGGPCGPGRHSAKITRPLIRTSIASGLGVAAGRRSIASQQLEVIHRQQPANQSAFARSVAAARKGDRALESLECPAITLLCRLVEPRGRAGWRATVPRDRLPRPIHRRSAATARCARIGATSDFSAWRRWRSSTGLVLR